GISRKERKGRKKTNRNISRKGAKFGLHLKGRIAYALARAQKLNRTLRRCSGQSARKGRKKDLGYKVRVLNPPS
ncbi:MAG: hypothetical protein ACXW5W_14015, partial [Candidatus Binatia bacterium]